MNQQVNWFYTMNLAQSWGRALHRCRVRTCIFMCTHDVHTCTPSQSPHPNGQKLRSKCILDKFSCGFKGVLFKFFATTSLLCRHFYLKSIQYGNGLFCVSLVVKQNFPNTNIIVNYHILIIHNWSGYSYINFCLAYNVKWIATPNTLFEKSMHISVIFW